MLSFNSFFEDLDFDMEPEQPRKRRFGWRGGSGGGGGGDDGGRRGGGGGDDGGDDGDGGDEIFRPGAGSTGIWDDDDRDDDEGRGPSRLARGKGLQRLGLLLLALLLIVGIGIWQVRKCQHQQEVDRYKRYATDANAVGKQSTDLGKQFASAILKQGQSLAGASSDVSALAQRQAAVAQSAAKVSGPGALAGVQAAQVQSLQMRANGLAAFSTALKKAGTTIDKDGNIADASKVALMRAAALLEGSDAIYSDSFAGPAQKALAAKGIKGAAIDPSQFVSDTTLIQVLTPESIRAIIGGWQLGSGTGGGGGGTPNCSDGKSRGTQIVSVAVKPAGVDVWSNDGSVADARKVPTSQKDTLEITFQNSGQVTLTNVKVTASINGTALTPGIQTVIDAGKSATVSLPFTTDAVSFNGNSKVIASVEPVQCETKTDNNTAKFNVLFQISSN